jgi:transposase
MDRSARRTERRALVLRTGAPWADLPRRHPPYQTCHRRFQLWQRSGRLDRLLQRLAEDLRDRGQIDLSEAFVDATFASAKKGALQSVRRAAVELDGTEKTPNRIIWLLELSTGILSLFTPNTDARHTDAVWTSPTMW